MPLEFAPYRNDRLLSYVDHREVDWRPNEPFAASMTVTSTSRGRSSAIFILTDERGREFPMFMTEMLHLVQVGDIRKGVIDGIWTVCKRGSNYGLRFVSNALKPQSD